MQTRIWKPLRAEVKLYGRPRLAIILGGCGLIYMMLFGILVGLIGSGLNYYFGCFLSKKLHDGKAQRFMNWYLPTIVRRSSPNNSIKYFY